MTLAPGTRLGPYEIVAPLGEGGMGEVYRARDPRLSRDVAVKVLPRSATEDTDRLARFEREARTIAGLSHPNLLAIFDVGTGEVPYLVTELLDGETLRSRLGRGAIGQGEAIGLALQLTAGLTAAHARGVVHRDLKPDNIFVTADGRLKILDFGLATTAALVPTDSTETTSAHTLPGMVLGTLGYLSPEQARARPVDQRTDIFACGAVLYEMLTGQRAFRGDSPADTIALVLHRPPSELFFGAGVAPALAATVRRCLEQESSRRFQSAHELAMALESISHDGTQAVGVVTAGAPGSVAVLPFVGLSAASDDQYFSDGLAEDLVNALARLPGLRVASRTSSFRFRDRELDLRAVGRELGVGAVLEGSVRRVGSRLRLTVHLTGVDDGYHIWSERFDRELADVFAVQDEVVRAIVTAVAPALVGGEGQAVRRSTVDPHAYDLYLKGRHLWNQRSPSVVGAAIACFEGAIAIDDTFAAAYAGLADCYSILRVYGWMPAAQAQPKALAAMTRALALDPQLPEAHRAKGIYTFHFEPHWRAAEEAFLAALALDPHDAICDATYGMFLATAYRYDDARLHLTRAVERDPFSAQVHFLIASTACAMCDADLAARHAARALELQPDALGPRWPQSVALLMTGRHAEAIELGEQIIARTRAPVFVGVMALVMGRAGRMDDARRLGEELYERAGRGEYVSPVSLLALALGLGDASLVERCLAACADGGAAPFGVVATNRWLLDSYRGTPAIDALLDRIHDGARPGEMRGSLDRSIS